MIEELFKLFGYVKEKPLIHRLAERQSKINGLRNEIQMLQSQLEIRQSGKVVPSKKEH